MLKGKKIQEEAILISISYLGLGEWGGPIGDDGQRILFQEKANPNLEI